MANYQKMYTILCSTVDDVINELSAIPSAHHASEHLIKALEQAEEIYIETLSDMDSQSNSFTLRSALTGG